MFGVKSFLSTILCLVALAAASPVLDDEHAGTSTEVMLMETENVFDASGSYNMLSWY